MGPEWIMFSYQKGSSTEWFSAHKTSSGFAVADQLIQIGVLLLLTGVLIPSLAYQKRHAQVQACVDNLKSVGIAFRIWAIDQTDQPSTGVSVKYGGTLELAATGQPFVHFRAMSNELSSPRILACPSDRTRNPASSFKCGFSDSSVSYFVSPDARDVYPQMLLMGDRNLANEGKLVEPGVFIWTSDRVGSQLEQRHPQ